MIFRILAKVLVKLQAMKSEQNNKMMQERWQHGQKKVEWSRSCTGRQEGETHVLKALTISEQSTYG